MKTRREYTAQYNVLATQLGLPTVNCLFRTLPIAAARVEALRVRVLAAGPPKTATPRRGRASGGVHNSTTHIVPLTESNPHREGTKDHKKWAKATAAATIDAAVAAGVGLAYVRYAAKRGLLRLELA